MSVIRKHPRRRPARDDGDRPELVAADITPGIAVYHNGEHRSGTITGVPYATAMRWLRRRWATCIVWGYQD